MSLDQDEQNTADTVADHFMEDNWPPQNIPLTVTDKSNKKKPGIIFLSTIPPGFNVTTTIAFFSQFGKVGRVFLQPGKVELLLLILIHLFAKEVLSVKKLEVEETKTT